MLVSNKHSAVRSRKAGHTVSIKTEIKTPLTGGKLLPVAAYPHGTTWRTNMTRKYIFLFSFCSLLTLAADLFAQPATPKQDPQAVLQSVCQSLIQQVDSEEFQKAYLPLEEKRDLLILVDKEHALPFYYTPHNLVSMPRRGALRKEALVWLEEMKQDARKEGVYLFPVSTYRSYDYQQYLKKHTHNSDQVADPGHSQHQLGTAIDFNTTTLNDEHLPALEWLKQYAGKYGFSLSFPKGEEEETGYPFEPWHYRYITQEGVAMQNKFFGGSQHKMLLFLNMCLWNKPDPKAATPND